MSAVEHLTPWVERSLHSLFKTKALLVRESKSFGMVCTQGRNMARAGKAFASSSKVAQYVHQAITKVSDQRHGQGSSHLVRVELLLNGSRTVSISLKIHQSIDDGREAIASSLSCFSIASLRNTRRSTNFCVDYQRVSTSLMCVP